MYFVEIKIHLEKIFKKLKKHDLTQFNALRKKLKEIQLNPFAFKPLHAPMQNKRRVHIMKSFVLIYSINEKEKKIIIEDYCHYDLVYK
jgi:mRNA-degrading endonuclease RelE of RelBE toxin-antitoxin system